MNQFNAINGEEPTKPPRDWNIQPASDNFKSSTCPPKTRPLVSAIMGRLNHCVVDNGDVEFRPSNFPVEFNSESVPDTDTTTVK